MAVPPTLRIQLLGAFRVTVNGRAVSERAWRSSRATSLIKVLALARGYRLHREQIADTLWPELDPAALANNLNVAASRARHALSTAGAPPGLFVTRSGAALTLGPADIISVDADAFEAAIAEGWRTQDPALFQSALGLYTDALLPDDLYEDWAEERRATLRTTHLAALARLAELHAERGEISYAIETAQRLVAVEPTHEETHVALMRWYARSGQTARALAQYDLLVAVLQRELDASPDRDTVELANAIRDGRFPTESVLNDEEFSTHERGRPARLSNLPTPLSDLIGRQREIAEVRQVLATGRLVTLTGTGGIGKTRLGLAVAQDVASSFTDGVTFVDLSPVHDPDLVVPTLAQTLDIRDPAGHPSPAALAAHLADRRLLLLLDNFEQLVDAAPIVTALLERTRHLKVLVTSRTTLRVTGEREYPVPRLGLPGPAEANTADALLDAPAVELFVHRARATKPDFTLSGDNAGTVAEICRRLDGLPLAIELAAARIKVLTPSTMLARLDRPLALLVSGPRDRPARQQTIRATIAWSHALLSPPEQRLLRRLSVFIGGWTLDAAEAVADANDTPSPGAGEVLGIAVLDGLASLVDKSLVTRRELPGGEERFNLLETVREFAAEQLTESVDEGSVRERHAAFAVELAERARPHLESGELVRWLGRLDREDGNLRAALRWLRQSGDAERALRLVTALKLYWFIRGRLREGCDETLSVATSPESVTFPALRVDALNSAAFLAREDSDYERAQRVGTEARTESERLGDPQRAADAVVNLGYVALQRGAYGSAQSLFGEYLTTNRRLGNQQGIADALSFLALTAYYENDLDTARRLNEESLAIWLALQDRQAVVWARTRLGDVLLRQGMYENAFNEFVDSLATARELDFPWGLSWTLTGLAHLAEVRGLHRLAMDAVSTAESIRDTAGLRLPPAEQTETDRLRERLAEALVPETSADHRSHQVRRTVDEVSRAVKDALDPWPTEGVGRLDATTIDAT